MRYVPPGPDKFQLKLTVLLVSAAATPHGEVVGSSRTDHTDVTPVRRAVPNAPDSYAPSEVDCPRERPEIRSAERLSPQERSWLETRRSNTATAMKDLFGHVEVGEFDAASYIDRVSSNMTALPNIGIAVSGGGYRALMNGAGALKAFDSRTAGSTESGHLGGILQSATYLSGLSGGGWLVGSLYVNNFTSVSEIQADETGSLWEFANSIFQGPEEDGLGFVNTLDYLTDIVDVVGNKDEAGYDTSMTDFWGRALSYQLINDTDGGPSYTWSSIANDRDFKDGNAPMPLLVADGRNPGELLVGGNATVYEFNPWEFGTFDSTVHGFVPLQYLGSKFDGGVLPDDEKCVTGFDNAGYIMGTSSSLFNQFLLQVNSTDIPDFVKDRLNEILSSIGADNNDIASYDPNPFFNYSNDTSPYAEETALHMVDGGEDLQNIPLHPLLQPERSVDVIFAVDSSADTTYSWPNGTAMVATYERSLNPTGISNGTSFPAVPDVNTFVNLGLNTKPTFFGCDSSNTTSMTPLVVYIPNHPYVAASNVTTFTPSYENTERDSIIQNGYDVATMANATRDENWPACVGCAILQRSMERTNTELPEICNTCFDTYCWDGTVNSTQPQEFEPTFLLDAVVAEDAAPATSARAALAVAGAMGAIFATMML
ncbi:Lysophospholipase 1 [Arachnomyces sp. PD_36]|nr:Lysophospholipase 1 [Arachnomyces sp. PD_36]